MVWCMFLYKFDTHQPLFRLFYFSLGNIAQRISEMYGVFKRVAGRFSIFTTFFFWFGGRTVNRRRFSHFLNTYGWIWDTWFIHVFQLWFVFMGWLVGFLFFFFVRGISLISQRSVLLPLFSLVYSCSLLVISLHLWIMYVCTWRVGFVLHCQCWILFLRRSCRNNLVVKEVFRTAAQKR